MNEFETACACLHKKTRSLLLQLPDEIKANVTEIVLRKNSSLYIVCKNKHLFVNENAQCGSTAMNSYHVSEEEVSQAVLRACGYSLYAHGEELRNGFVSIGNGCRMAVIGHFGCVKDALSDLSVIHAVKIRIARDLFLDTSFIYKNSGICSALIVGPPACGKTTLLRSIVRNVAEINNNSLCGISVVDERGEIFPSTLQIPANVDVISGISKADGINMAVRLYSAQVVVCDEIGTLQEAQIIRNCLNSGVIFICSMHAGNEDELFRRACFVSLSQVHAFEKIVFMKDADNPGAILRIAEYKEKNFA